MPATSLRDAHARSLEMLGSRDQRVWVLDADLSLVSKTSLFAERHPKRFVQCGIREQHMVSFAMGLAQDGAIPYVHSLATFLCGRGYDQIKMVALSGLPVKFIGVHSGLCGQDGPTHHMLEDFALMSALPNMTVFCPADFAEAFSLTWEMSKSEGPVYMRLPLPKLPLLHNEHWKAATELPLGYWCAYQATLYSDQTADVHIIATGATVAPSILAAKELEREYAVATTVWGVWSITPFPARLIGNMMTMRNILVVEEHNPLGGLGSIVASIAGDHGGDYRVAQMGVEDWGLSGTPQELFEHFGLTPEGIVQKALELD